MDNEVKIIKKGELKNIKVYYECEDCGCEWENIHTIGKNINTYKLFYRMSCPTCEKTTSGREEY